MTARPSLNYDKYVLKTEISPSKFNGRRHVYTAFIYNIKKPIQTIDIYNYLQKKGIKDVIVEPKYDGLYVQVAKDGSEVRVWSDLGNDLTANISSKIVEKVKQLSCKTLVAEGELELFINGKHEARGLITGLIHRRKRNLSPRVHEVVTLFDCLYLNGVDISTKNTQERLNSLKTLRLPQLLTPIKVPLNMVPYWRVKNPTSLQAVAKKICKLRHFEGIIIKPTNQTAHNLKFIKFKKYIEFALSVLKRIPTRTRGVYNYDLGALTREGKLIKVARSYNTRLRLTPGDHAAVACFNVSAYMEDGKIKRVHLYAPKIQTKTTAPVNSVDIIVKTAKAFGVLEMHRKL